MNIVVDDKSVLVVGYILLLLDIHFDSMKKVIVVVVVVVAAAAVAVVVDNTYSVFLINYSDDVDDYLNWPMDTHVVLY